ncbi:hypothetical protein Rleg4DRAFT_7697 [Rhizobium leguminosarum bv. trifolii WSM2297]|uniref:Uncharacterized protein n=1 Tax=Rhizobium leguminosarum bv. trifolii WSM2297 TaxID=754762 RepID=J0D0H8_RHILT|nr:hypothetical protein [Rhizobium leguminosarum]EJC85316.1 hypothetical protein Rleg4DRAFT_7195 [Rhizobium leguminosarum bv. trifolii WSM2297]EJC85800.1 hypothetical protein Rleg4DRAFT_7697 [Rhizobium leguminosarum bv. trifolii WSM2297]
MEMNEFSAKTFQRKIDAFCQLRLSPLLRVDELRRLRDYLYSLIKARRSAPRTNGKTDWDVVAAASGIDAKELAANARQIDPALDAIARWIRDTRLAAGAEKPDVRKPAKTSRTKAAPPAVARAAPQVQEPPVKSKPAGVASARVAVEFPEALFKVWEDPTDFAEALQLHLRRHGETYWTLYRGIIGPDDLTDKNTLLSWIEGRRVPRSTESFHVLSRIERRYRLPEGYFKAKLSHPSRSASGFNLSGIKPAERRRLAWHLPEDFNLLPFRERPANAFFASTRRGLGLAA